MYKTSYALVVGLIVASISTAVLAGNFAPVTPLPPTSKTTAPAKIVPIASTFHPAYGGVMLGYGNTNWNQMISQDLSSSKSTPISAGGSGFAEGLMIGYSLSRYFALEGDYTHYPDADLVFEPKSVYQPLTQTSSKTNSYALFGKFMVPLGNSGFSPFSEIGPGYVQRNDDLAQKGHFGGAFGVGVDYNINSRWMTELGLQYYTGYGDSTIKPAYDYIPFLYTVNLRIAYRFSL